MAISTFFQEEITAVDATKLIAYNSAGVGYGTFEFSYAFSGSTYTVTGGSELACEYGASDLLEALGYRFYAPSSWGRKRPASITTGLSAAKKQWWMPNNTIFLGYGHSWRGTYNASYPNAPVTADDTALDAAMDRWLVLNGMKTGYYPSGHRWVSIVNNNLAFFQANLDLIKGGAIPANIEAVQFDLDNIVSGPRREVLETICAAEILKTGLTVAKTSHFDPSDGNPHTSEQIFKFCNDVVARVRAGTAAIATIPAQTGVPDARLGVYAYANHALPPTFDMPNVYVQVALAFNDTGISYADLVTLFGEKSESVLLREYLDIQAWFESKPGVNSRGRTDYISDNYSIYHAAGSIGSTAEFQANWLINLAMCRQALRFMKTGTSTFAQAVNDVMADLFNNDAAVRFLFELWADRRQTFNRWNLHKMFQKTDAMVAGWYKTYFEQYAVIMAELEFMPIPLDTSQQTVGDPFPAAFSSYMSKVTAVRLQDFIHSYAIARRHANSGFPKAPSNVTMADYPTLGLSAVPQPGWFLSPVAPTRGVFETYRDLLAAEMVHDEDLDSTDLVLVTGLVGTYAAARPNPGDRFYTEGAATFWFVGPGTVTSSPASLHGTLTGGEILSSDYPDGLHSIFISGDYLTTFTGGFLFLDTFTQVTKRSDGTGRYHWLYIPQRVVGVPDISSSIRLSVTDSQGVVTITPSTPLARALDKGQVAVNNSLTTGITTNMGINRYMSLRHDVALMPREIAEEDFPARASIDIA
jgi:hypothetical protein